MKETKVISVTKFVPHASFLPNGAYHGLWSGHTVNLKHDGSMYELITDDGVRGINCPCVIHISDGIATVNIK